MKIRFMALFLSATLLVGAASCSNAGQAASGALASGATSEAAATITLAGDSISIDGSGATAEGSIVTITAAGRYVVSGTLNDGAGRRHEG